eukprot:scaffold2621_cov31-Tisochrysis_lutea.AAC.8
MRIHEDSVAVNYAHLDIGRAPQYGLTIGAATREPSAASLWRAHVDAMHRCDVPVQASPHACPLPDVNVASACASEEAPIRVESKARQSLQLSTRAKHRLAPAHAAVCMPEAQLALSTHGEANSCRCSRGTGVTSRLRGHWIRICSKVCVRCGIGCLGSRAGGIISYRSSMARLTRP